MVVLLNEWFKRLSKSTSSHGGICCFEFKTLSTRRQKTHGFPFYSIPLYFWQSFINTNPTMWPLKWKLCACTYAWCYLVFKISLNEISKIGQGFLLAKFGSERVHRKEMNSQVFMLWPPEKPLWRNSLPFWLGYIVLMTAKENMSLIRIEKNLTCEIVHVPSQKA